MEQRIESELGVINSDSDYDQYSAEQKLAGATKTANYKSIAYAKIVDNFKTLAEQATPMLLATEGLRINLQDISEDANFNDDDPEGNSQVDKQGSQEDIEEKGKDGWMTNYT